MFNIGLTELIVIGAIALIFIGPKQLPEVARSLGKFLNELKRASDEAMQVFKDTHSKSDAFFRDTDDGLKKLVSDISSIDITGERKPVAKVENKTMSDTPSTPTAVKPEEDKS